MAHYSTFNFNFNIIYPVPPFRHIEYKSFGGNALKPSCLSFHRVGRGHLARYLLRWNLLDGLRNL